MTNLETYLSTVSGRADRATKVKSAALDLLFIGGFLDKKKYRQALRIASGFTPKAALLAQLPQTQGEGG